MLSKVVIVESVSQIFQPCEMKKMRVLGAAALHP